MKLSIKIVSIVLIVIVVLTIGIVLYNSGALVSTKQLQTEGFKQLSIPDSETYVASFNSDKAEAVRVSVDVGNVTPGQGALAYMTFYIQSFEDVGGFDSLYLNFTTTNPFGFFRFYLGRPGNQFWPPMIFRGSADGRSTIVGVDDLGVSGTYGIEFGFYLEPSQTTSFWFRVNFTTQPTGFPPTRQAGSAQIELPITYANAT
jgi:hypothetical protein